MESESSQVLVNNTAGDAHGNGNSIDNLTLNTNLSTTTLGFSTACHSQATTAYTVLLIIIVIAGLIGNTLSVIILHVKSRRTNFNFLLKVISYVDIVILLLLPVDRMLYNGLPCAYSQLFIYLNITDKLGGFARFASVWMLIVIAFFRFMAVCLPMKVKLFCTYRNAKICVAAVFVLDVVIHIPFYFQYEIVSNVNSSLYSLQHSNFSMTSGFRTYAHVFYTTCLFFAFPFISLIFFSINMIRTLYGKDRLKYLEYSHLKHEANDVTKIVIAIILAFMISYTPYLVWTIETFIPGRRNNLSSGACSKLMYRYTMDLFLYINSSVNFFIYVLFRKQFRRSLYELFTCYRRKLGYSSDGSTYRRSFTATSELTHSMCKDDEA